MRIGRPGVFGLLGVLALAACTDRTPQPNEARIARLERQVTDLAAQVQADQARLAQLAAPKAETHEVELVVSWPENSNAGYRKTYPTAKACEAARQAVFAENARRQAAAEAEVGKPNASGAVTVAVGPQPAASAVCLPA